MFSIETAYFPTHSSNLPDHVNKHGCALVIIQCELSLPALIFIELLMMTSHIFFYPSLIE